MVKVTGYITLTVNITILSSLLAAFLPMKEVALFMQCVQYAGTEWCLIALLRFMEEYTKGNYARRWTRITFYVLTGMSNLSLLLNCVFHHVVTNRLLTTSTGFTCFVYDNEPGYLIHFSYCAILALCNVSILITKTLKSPEATTKLISSIIKEDKETGKTYLNIPVPDKDSVQQALTLLTKLLSH